MKHYTTTYHTLARSPNVEAKTGFERQMVQAVQSSLTD